MRLIKLCPQQVVLLPAPELPVVQVPAARAAQRAARAGLAEGRAAPRLLQHTVWRLYLFTYSFSQNGTNFEVGQEIFCSSFGAVWGLPQYVVRYLPQL